MNNKSVINIERLLLPKNILFVHFIITSIGLIRILKRIAVAITSSHMGPLELNDWALLFYYPNKPFEISQYLISVTILAVFYSLLYFMYSRVNWNGNQLLLQINTPGIFTIYVVILFSLNVILPPQVNNVYFDVILAGVYWVLVFVFPFVKYSVLQKIFQNAFFIDSLKEITNNNKIKSCLYVFIGFIIVQFVLMIFPFVFQKIKLINEYFDLPEVTIINNVEYDNTLFINKYNILGDQDKYDIKTNSGNNDVVNEQNFGNILTQENKCSGYWNEKELIQKFLKYNTPEIHWQILNRWAIHHHNHIIGPINEISLGKSINEVYAQYGRFNALFVKNIMDLCGGISYDNYFKVYYSFYYGYYFLYFFVVWLVFKKVEYIFPIISFSIIALEIIGFNYLFMGPGINPARHLFDLFIILFLYKYFQNNKWYYLLLCFSFSLLGIINNFEIGIFCFVGLLFVLSIKYFILEKRIKYGIVILTLYSIFALLLANVSMNESNEITMYFAKGLLGFTISVYEIYLILITFGISYIIIIKNINKRNPFVYLSLFLFVYSQCLLIYYIWCSDRSHFLAFAQIYILTAFALILNELENDYIKKLQYLFKYFMIIVAAIGFILFTGFYYYNKHKDYDIVINTHKLYIWDFERAGLISTINQKYFKAACDLIKKYSKEEGIFIISKYDNIIPFISNRYSKMPYIDLAWYLITKKEVNKCISIIENSKPNFIFIDSDIHRDYDYDRVQKYSLYFSELHEESISRIKRHRLLQDIYKSISHNYSSIEKTNLLTVYKRNGIL